MTAVDVTSGLEVSVVGPSSAARTELERIALQKLRYMLAKKDDPAKAGNDDPGTPTSGGSGGGIIV